MNALWIFLLISMGPIASHGYLEFNNVRCIVRDRTFVSFDYCFLKSVNRTYKYFSMKTRILNLPVNNCVTTFQVRLRENKRILYNFDVKLDACKFMRERNNVLGNYMYQMFAPYSNINHTCPYDHDLFVEKLPVQYVNKLIQTVIPEGRYYLNSTWATEGITRAELLLYITKN
ncbi:hypothetical protein KR009_008179 [Drosophila setifemur]|nr:hypothetical protein KR009_008179 [Drosophila setifemur]